MTSTARPATASKRRQLPRVFSREEAQAILRQSKTRVSKGKFPVSLRNRCALECLYLAGLRASELCDLRVRDVDLQQRLLYVRHSKRDKSRNVPIDPRLMPWLAQWAEARTCIRSDAPSEWFFCSGSGAKTTQPQLFKIVQRCCEAAGLDATGASPHTFRHTYATERLEDGFDIKEVAMLLGHASVATTEIYLHVRPQTLMAKVQALGQPKEKDPGRQCAVCAKPAKLDYEDQPRWPWCGTMACAQRIQKQIEAANCEDG